MTDKKLENQVEKVINTKGQKELKNENKLNGIKKFGKTVLPWLIILAIVCVASGYQLGHQKGVSDQKTINNEISSEVAQLKLSQK